MVSRVCYFPTRYLVSSSSFRTLLRSTSLLEWIKFELGTPKIEVNEKIADTTIITRPKHIEAANKCRMHWIILMPSQDFFDQDGKRTKRKTEQRVRKARVVNNINLGFGRKKWLSSPCVFIRLKFDVVSSYELQSNWSMRLWIVSTASIPVSDMLFHCC